MQPRFGLCGFLARQVSVKLDSEDSELHSAADSVAHIELRSLSPESIVMHALIC